MRQNRTLDKPRLLGLVWPFIVVVLLQAMLAGGSLYVLSAVRSYVGGESLWSKGQKDAIYYLTLYADSRADEDFRRYEEAIAIPLGDREMRLALDQPDPDIEAACQGILKGGNHADDVTAIIWLYRNFHDFSYFERAIELWLVGDKYVMELIDVAGKMRAGIGAGQASAEQVQQWKTEIHAINEKVTPAAKAFSDALGEGSRALLRLLLVANLTTASVLILLAFLRIRQQLMQRQEVENALDAERERAQITLASIGDGVITADTQGGISYLNPAAEQMTNWTLDKARGLPLASLFRIVDESSREEGMLLIEQILSGEIDGGREHSKLVLRHDGSSVPVTLVGAPIHRGGEITGVVLVLHDMTRERQYMARLSWQATHDALTGLTNRREFEYRLQIALERLERNSGRHALMFLDLDQFKLVNDTCGHAAGDELLRQVCTLLQQGLREGDTLARLGGDEFGILLENCPAEKAVEIADHLRKTVQDLHFTWSGQPFNCTVSVGLVHLLPGISTLEEALRSADMACYMAKEKGRNRVQVFHQDDVELSMRFGEMTWVQRIHLALEEDRFSLYAQPIVPLGEGAEEGLHVELLLRLRDEGGRLVPPLSFIPAAERYGLMTLIDRWVVENAFPHPRRARPGPSRRADRHLRHQPLRRDHRRRVVPAVPHRAVRPLPHSAADDLLRGHRNRGGCQPGQRHPLHQRAQGHRLSFLPGRFLRRHVVLHLPQAPAGGLPEDRWQLRQGHARGSHRSRHGPGDQPYRPRDGQTYHRRVRRDRRSDGGAARDRHRLCPGPGHRRAPAVQSPASGRRAGCPGPVAEPRTEPPVGDRGAKKE